MKPIRNLPLIALLFALPCLAQLDPADNQIWVQGAFGVPGDAEGNDSFGSDLAAGDANNDGAMDLAVASVGENNGRGRVTIIHGGRMGLTGAGSVEFDQDNNDIEGNDEANDNFGSATASTTSQSASAAKTTPPESCIFCQGRRPALPPEAAKS